MNDYDIGSAKNVQVELNHSAQFQPNIQQNQIEPISYSGIFNNQTVKCIICPSCQTTFQIPKENMKTNQNLNQQLLQNNIPIDYNFEVSLNRRMLIQKINLLNIYQQLFQVLLMLLCNLFFPIYRFDDIRVIFVLIIPITIAFLLIVRFNKSLRKVPIISKNRVEKVNAYILYIFCFTPYSQIVQLLEKSIFGGRLIQITSLLFSIIFQPLIFGFLLPFWFSQFQFMYKQKSQKDLIQILQHFQFMLFIVYFSYFLSCFVCLNPLICILCLFK